ncbi:hypothetical protein A3F37_03615 [Candidatus Saccharibacteria bacterium RIFCSPHIGHO2_12_FULL_41_12]|nr:MAG: hypothetical protein A3F37_03615 [Candidatus Saccharibacteria bacterium RIFCSPHIGHO2_12_FULL_41_12]
MTTDQIQQQKQYLRKHFLDQRKQLDSSDVAERSEKLVCLLINEIDWTKTKTMHCFLPIIGSNEPDMRDLIQHATLKSVKVFMSVPAKPVDKIKGTELKTFALGDNTVFDQIIVPMLAYDPATKHRLGFGGGFYDQLLASQKSAQSIGVCFKEFTAKGLPTESTDYPLNKIFIS